MGLIADLGRKSRTVGLEQLKKNAAQARLPFDKDMLLNIAFFLDHQYTEWVPDLGMVRQIPRRPRSKDEQRPVVNKIMHFVMQEHAQALQNDPTIDVLPASDHPFDSSTAQVANAYCRWLSEPQQADFEAELSDATFWALIAGEGFLKWSFDPLKKRPNIESVCPLDIYIDPFANRFGHARWIVQESFMDVKDVEGIYGKKVRPSQVDSNKSALLREMGQAPVLEGAVVNELWIKPGTPGHPDGLFVVWSGRDILIEPRPFPYTHGQLPYTQLGSIPRPKTAHYTCAVKYLRSPAMELNAYHAQKLSVRRLFANPKWWIPNDLELEADPDDTPGQILRGNSNGGTLKPEIIQGSLMTDSQDGEWIRQEMMDVVGLHEVSNAQVPGRVEAAKAIELLKEADSSRLAELQRTIKKSISNGFWQVLMLARQYVTEEQIVQTYSPEGYPEVNRFKAKDLKPEMRVRCTMGTGLGNSRAARVDSAILLWQNGVIRDPEVFAQMIDVPVETVSPQRAYDIRLARNENYIIAGDGAKGVALQPNSWDEHDVHIREHNNYRKTAEFHGKPDDVKQKFEFHVQMHKELQLKVLEEEAMKQAVLAQAGQPQPTPEETAQAAAAEAEQPQV